MLNLDLATGGKLRLDGLTITLQESTTKRTKLGIEFHPGRNFDQRREGRDIVLLPAKNVDSR